MKSSYARYIENQENIERQISEPLYLKEQYNDKKVDDYSNDKAAVMILLVNLKYIDQHPLQEYRTRLDKKLTEYKDQLIQERFTTKEYAMYKVYGEWGDAIYSHSGGKYYKQGTIQFSSSHFTYPHSYPGGVDHHINYMDNLVEIELSGISTTHNE